VGSPNRSNSNRLKELAIKLGTPAYLIDAAEDILPAWLDGKATIGVTAGASAPEALVRQVVAHLRDCGAEQVEEGVGPDERVVFPLPRELQQ